MTVTHHLARAASLAILSLSVPCAAADDLRTVGMQPAAAVTDVPSVPAAPGADDAPPPFPTPADLPGGRAGAVFYIAFAINRLLWALKRMRGILPDPWQPYLPFLAAVLGLLTGILDAVLTGAPWITAILTGLAGAAGAVAWREGTRAYDHLRSPKTPPSPLPPSPDAMSDGDLAATAS